MNRTNPAALAALLAAFALTACQLKPGGQCASQSDCVTGRLCLDGVCVLPAPGGASCTKDLECAPWATCQSGACVMDAGRCSVSDDCDEWEYCDPNPDPNDPDFVPYSCRLKPGRCISPWVASCPHGYEGWVVCDDTNTCVPGPGRCGEEADCKNAWESCDLAAHTCRADSGYCSTNADCPGQGDWEVCGADHTCELVAGRCADDSICGPYQTCDATHVCVDKQVSAARVYATGQLKGTFGWGAYGFAPVDDGFDVRLDLVWPHGSPALGNFSYVRADGSVVFMVMEAGGYQIRRFAPEWPTWDGYKWVGPPSPLANDLPVLVSNTDCGNIQDFVMQAGSEAILYDCPDPNTTAPRYYAVGTTPATGTPVVTGRRVVAWTQGGLMLAIPSNSPDAAYVIDASGVEKQVVGLPSGMILQSARADGEAFRLAVLFQGVAGAAERWRIAADGTPSREGVFADPPAGGARATSEWGYGVLDAAGDLYQYDWPDDVIIRRPLATVGASVIVRGNDVATTGLGTGVNDTEATQFVPYVWLSSGTTLLFTSP